MRGWLGSMSLMVILASPVAAQDDVCVEPGPLLVGTPSVRISVTPDTTITETLSAAEAFEYQLLVDCDVEGYIVWVSRGGGRLVASQSGVFMTLADTDGNGAIYLFTALGVETWSRLNEVFEGDPQVHWYSETIRSGINQVIYYGPAPEGLQRLSEVLCPVSIWSVFGPTHAERRASC